MCYLGQTHCAKRCPDKTGAVAGAHPGWILGQTGLSGLRLLAAEPMMAAPSDHGRLSCPHSVADLRTGIVLCLRDA